MSKKLHRLTTDRIDPVAIKQIGWLIGAKLFETFKQNISDPTLSCP